MDKLFQGDSEHIARQNQPVPQYGLADLRDVPPVQHRDGLFADRCVRGTLPKAAPAR